MNLTDIKIPANYLNVVLQMCVFVLVIIIVTNLFPNTRDFDGHNLGLKEIIIDMFRVSGYGFLVYVIYTYYENKVIGVDILTFFTFMLSCIETTSAICTLIEWIIGILKLITFGKFNNE